MLSAKETFRRGHAPGIGSALLFILVFALLLTPFVLPLLLVSLLLHWLMGDSGAPLANLIGIPLSIIWCAYLGKQWYTSMIPYGWAAVVLPVVFYAGIVIAVCLVGRSL